MYQLEEKIWFWLMILPILVAFLFFINEIWKSSTQQGFKPFSLLIRLYANMQAGHIVLMSLISLIFMILALVNPQIGSKDGNL